MSRLLHIAAVLWAWGCWIWVFFSHEWVWLIPSVIPYFAYTTFGHRADRQGDK